jgi:hypothetical protein
MALQMEERPALDRAHLLALVIGEADRSRTIAKRRHVVKRRIDVDLGPRIPELAVLAEGLIHGPRSLRRGQVWRSPDGYHDPS